MSVELPNGWTNLKLGCGCRVVVEHAHGERRVVCAGGGLSMPPGAVSPSQMVECPGGRGYVVRAETVETVLHTARPIKHIAAKEDVA